jgi:hypothetical protein
MALEGGITEPIIVGIIGVQFYCIVIGSRCKNLDGGVLEAD